MLFLITVLSRSVQIVQIRVMLPHSPSAMCERGPPQPGEPSGGQLPVATSHRSPMERSTSVPICSPFSGPRVQHGHVVCCYRGINHAAQESSTATAMLH